MDLDEFEHVLNQLMSRRNRKRKTTLVTRGVFNVDGINKKAMMVNPK